MKNRLPSRGFFVIVLAAVALPVAWSWWRERTKPKPYVFPVAELAALDRDLQARFAIVPTKDFGLYRIGPMHHLYVPENALEKSTIQNLKKHGWDVAFYLMSRRTWRNEQGPIGYYPIQGPVYITRKITAPPPRKKLYEASRIDKFSRMEEPSVVEQANPDGTPVPPTMPLDGLPPGRRLREVGDRVFDDAAHLSADDRVGASTMANQWRVAAVPVRASNEACVKCHNGWNHQDNIQVKLGDALGVAMYAFKRAN